MPGEAPAELFRDLESVGLCPFRVVRAQIDVGKPPVVPVRHLRTQPVHIVVVPADREDAGAVDGGAGDLPRLQIVGDEDGAGEAQAGGVRRDAVREVSRGGTGEDREAELHGARGSDGNHSILVGTGGVVYRVVLDVQLADAEPFRKSRGANERGEPGMKACARFSVDWQELAVAPQVLRARFDQLTRDEPGDRRIVVGDLERAETLVADPGGRGGKTCSAEMTPEAEVHAVLSCSAAVTGGLAVAG